MTTTIGGRLKQWLAFKGWSVRDLSERSGVAYRTLQNYLRDDRQPGALHLSRLAHAGVDLNWLVLPAGAAPGDTDAIIADHELVRAMTGIALNLSDDVQRHRIEKDAPALDVRQLIAVARRMMWYGFRHARGMAPAIAEMRSKKVDASTVAALVMTDVKHRAIEEALGADILTGSHRDDALDYLSLLFSLGERPLSKSAAKPAPKVAATKKSLVKKRQTRQRQSPKR